MLYIAICFLVYRDKYIYIYLKNKIKLYVDYYLFNFLSK